MTPICRGSWRLRSACGQCRRCVVELLSLLQQTRTDVCACEKLDVQCPHQQIEAAISYAVGKKWFRVK